ncbi:sugar phosphate isomerase/epimerase [Ruegeria sp. 2205SS24-7]|uniref:sugar phosphate isomerase/epimerase family protein n=1 Tax=Ruegeria discodermiae TaxID=3064389 RepID=UPI00274285E3|nr:sugar phosphate isomerase/epimerase [Ruegeria sp. 2205SS24-7]MDP5217329.1 sugar phosphate isomerase/epimerase [Ruegeria sp. 2205SS24-7]
MTAFGYQLYSSRNFPPLTDTLPMLAGLGYEEIEGYGALFQDANLLRELRIAMEQTGLRMPTAHFGVDFVRQSPTEVTGLCRQIGIETVFFPFLMPEKRPSDAQGWEAFGKSLSEIGKPLQDAGLAFGWHNHDFELADLGVPEAPLDLILQASEDLVLELDVAWVARGGRDPFDYISRYKDRLRAAHIKDTAPDGACADEDGWADVGQGTLDWVSLHAALQGTSTRHFIMEHDNPSDHVRFATRSLAAARSLGEGQ